MFWPGHFGLVVYYVLLNVSFNSNECMSCQLQFDVNY